MHQPHQAKIWMDQNYDFSLKVNRFENYNWNTKQNVGQSIKRS